MVMPTPFSSRTRPPDIALGLWVQPGGRLVEKKHFGLVDQRAGDRESLFLSARQIVRPRLGLFGKIDAAEQLHGVDIAPIQGSEQVQQFDQVQLVKVFAGLKLHADNLLDAERVLGDIYAADECRTAVNVVQALEHFQGSGLAGAIGPENAVNLALEDLEGNAVDRGELA